LDPLQTFFTHFITNAVLMDGYDPIKKKLMLFYLSTPPNKR